MKSNNYLKWALELAPRLLSQIDRDPNSPTYGCCDRNFWHYKIRDFPSAILQQAGLGLALLYSTKFEGNDYYKHEEIKQIALATVHYWQSIQHKDGSFDEYWPNEHSIPPTVFSLFTTSEICRTLQIKNKAIFSSIEKAAYYLAKHREQQALNQEVASMCALYSASLTLQSEQIKKLSEQKLEWLLEKQNEEGWFSEYQGVDIGYLSVSLNFMAEYYRLSKDERAKTSITKIIDFIKYFIHPDGSFGGDYGTRNTEYFLAGGFAIASDFIPESAYYLEKLVTYAKDNYYIDDRYLTHYVFHSIIRAGIINQTNKQEGKLPFESTGEWFFEKGGLIIKSTKTYYLICSLVKGGVLVVFDKKNNKRIVNDCGYRIQEGKQILVTNWVTEQYKGSLSKNTIEITSQFYENSFKVPSPILHLGLRILSKIFKQKVTRLLKSIFILQQKPTQTKLKRKILITDKTIELNDVVQSNATLKNLQSTQELSLRYCPSSRYYQKSMNSVLRYEPLKKTNKKKIEIKRTLFSK